MKRRSFVATTLAVLASSETLAASRIELVYVGAQECPYCKLWRRREQPALVTAPLFKQIAFTEIEPRRIRDAYNPRYWPARLLPILQSLLVPDGTPRFLVLKDGVLYGNHLGDWPESLTELRRLTGSA
jgi:hypothetical protein